MKCLLCGSTVEAGKRCASCGADWFSSLRPRATTRETLELTPELEDFEDPFTLELPLGQRPIIDRKARTEADAKPEIRWGGYLRRSVAFFVDLLVLVSLSVFFFWLSYLGYTVGLAAHQRTLSPYPMGGFIRFFVFGWLGLVIGYFILFHGLGGKTFGKWLFGLRVVGANRAPITYRQAMIRSVGCFLSALFFGLGILWIIWSREKRGWHDLLAGTWVIRESRVRHS